MPITDLRVFLETVPMASPGRPLSPLPDISKDEILLFFKLYNPLEEELK